MNCPKTCGLCPGGEGPRTVEEYAHQKADLQRQVKERVGEWIQGDPCRDDDAWAERCWGVECGLDPANAEKFCPRTCGKCTPWPPGTPPVTEAPTTTEEPTPSRRQSQKPRQR